MKPRFQLQKFSITAESSRFHRIIACLPGSAGHSHDWTLATFCGRVQIAMQFQGYESQERDVLWTKFDISKEFSSNQNSLGEDVATGNVMPCSVTRWVDKYRWKSIACYYVGEAVSLISAVVSKALASGAGQADTQLHAFTEVRLTSKVKAISWSGCSGCPTRCQANFI